MLFTTLWQFFTILPAAAWTTAVIVLRLLLGSQVAADAQWAHIALKNATLL